MRTRLILAAVVLLALALPACSDNIGEIKKLLDGPSVIVTGVVTYVRPGECYIEPQDRASGIWVIGNTAAIYPGDEITAAGSLSTINGERVVYWSSIYPTGEQKFVAPLGMPLSRIGGSWFGYQDCASDRRLFKYVDHGEELHEWRWVPPIGLNNTGLLVTTWGKVISTDYSAANGLRWFHLDDSSGMLSDLGDRGVIVYSDADVKYGQIVSVTGISGVEAGIDDTSHLIRTIRPRNTVDVQVRREPVSEYPFSDDFEGEGIDTHWATVSELTYDKQVGIATTGTLSVGSGEMKIDVPVGGFGGTPAYSGHLVQSVEGDWDMEVKLRVVPTLGIAVHQCIGVVIKDNPTALAPFLLKGAEPVGVNWLAAITPQTSDNPDEITGRMRYVVADTEVGYPGTQLNTLAKTAWFKVRKRGGIIYGSASTDGVTYTREYSTVCHNRCYLAIYGYSWGMRNFPGPFTGYCDYIRFTRVSDGGGQL